MHVNIFKIYTVCVCIYIYIVYVCVLCIFISGATDHKTHGSDHGSDFESRIGSFFGSAKKSFTTISFTTKVSNKPRTITQIN